MRRYLGAMLLHTNPSPGQKQQRQHDVVEIPVVQGVVGAHAETGADQRAGHRQQRQPEDVQS